jgi:hypothetical protein
MVYTLCLHTCLCCLCMCAGVWMPACTHAHVVCTLFTHIVCTQAHMHTLFTHCLHIVYTYCLHSCTRAHIVHTYCLHSCTRAHIVCTLLTHCSHILFALLHTRTHAHILYIYIVCTHAHMHTCTHCLHILFAHIVYTLSAHSVGTRTHRRQVVGAWAVGHRAHEEATALHGGLRAVAAAPVRLHGRAPNGGQPLLHRRVHADLGPGDRHLVAERRLRIEMCLNRQECGGN